MEKPQENRLRPEIDWLALARTAQYRASILAPLLGMSRRQSERCFAESCGLSPQDWLDQVRLWIAALLLIEGRKPKEIFADLGFSDHSTFYHKFKKHHGCTPMEYVAAHVHGFAREHAKLRELFPGEDLPAEWKNQSRPFIALEILRRKIQRSQPLAIHYLQTQCRSKTQNAVR